MCLLLREVRVLGAAVLVHHLAEHSCEACVVVSSDLVVDVVLSVVLICARLSGAADESSVEDMAVSCRDSKVILPRAVSCTVVRILRVILAVAAEIAEAVRIVAESIVDLSLREFLILGVVLTLEDSIACYLSEESGSISVSEAAPVGQPAEAAGEYLRLVTVDPAVKT